MRNAIAVLERIWRNVFVYPLLRLIIRNKPAELPIDLTRIESILILRYDKIGDMVVTLPIFKILKDHNPQVRIGVLASQVNSELLVGDGFVDDIYVMPKSPFGIVHLLWRIRKAHFQVVLNFIFNRMTSGALICQLACRDAITIGQGNEKYRFYFNVLLSLRRGSMLMFEMLIQYVEQVFGMKVAEEEKTLYLNIDAITVTRVDHYLERHGLRRRICNNSTGLRYVVFNFSARQTNKKLSFEQATSVVQSLKSRRQVRTIVIAAPEDRSAARQIVSALESDSCTFFPESGRSSLTETASLIQGALGVVTPDTSIVHIASAVSTPILGIFTPLQVNKEWLPYRVQHELVVAPDNEPVSKISAAALVRGIDSFLAHMGVD